MKVPEQVKKSDLTKHRITMVFLDLLRRRPLSDISVKDITERCGINRNTFYYHFDNLADLIEYSVKNIVDDILAQYPPKIDSIEECFIAAINSARENSQIINNIYHSANRAAFERHLWHVCDYSVNAYLNSIPQGISPARTPEEREILQNLLRFELFGFIIDWVNHDMPPDVESKIATLSALLSPYKPTNPPLSDPQKIPPNPDF